MPFQWVAFHVTDRCQLDCDHCLRDPAQKPTDLPLALIERVLDDAKRLYGVRHVALAGGEPTLHPQFVEILDAIAARGDTWHVVTNGRRFERLAGWLLDEPRRREAMRAIDLSLDGADEVVHDGIRGAGSFAEVMRAASLCTVHGFPFALQMTVHARNAAQIEAMGLLAGQLGASSLSFAMAQPTGTKHDAGLYLPAAAWRQVRDRIDRLAKALTLPVTMPEGFPTPYAFHVCSPFRSEQLHVDVQGRLNLCCQHSGIPAGNGHDDIAGDLATTSLVEAHGKLVGIIHKTQQGQLERIARGGLSEWDYFPCNACLASFGKPHWTDEGAGGAAAVRERWRGAWAPEGEEPSDGAVRRLKVVD